MAADARPARAAPPRARWTFRAGRRVACAPRPQRHRLLRGRARRAAPQALLISQERAQGCRERAGGARRDYLWRRRGDAWGAALVDNLNSHGRLRASSSGNVDARTRTASMRVHRSPCRRPGATPIPMERQSERLPSERMPCNNFNARLKQQNSSIIHNYRC